MILFFKRLRIIELSSGFNNLRSERPVLYQVLLKGTFIPPERSDVKKWGIPVALKDKRQSTVIVFSALFRRNQRMRQPCGFSDF